MNCSTGFFTSTVFPTVISGVLVFIFGQMVQNFIFKPILKYKGVVGRIDNGLKYYDQFISNPGGLREDTTRDCSRNLRKLSCDLEEARKQLVLRTCCGDGDVAEAARCLIHISNSVGSGPGNSGAHNAGDSDKIRDLLGIQVLK